MKNELVVEELYCMLTVRFWILFIVGEKKGGIQGGGVGHVGRRFRFRDTYRSGPDQMNRHTLDLLIKREKLDGGGECRQLLSLLTLSHPLLLS